MGWQYTPYALFSLATAAVAAGLSLYAWRRRGVPGAAMGALFMAAVSVWGLAYALDLSVTGLSAKVFWAKVSYAGIVVVPLAWFGFAASYTGRGAWLSGRNLALLSVVPVLTLALVWTNERHRLFWETVALDSSGSFVGLDSGYGWAFWGWLVYAYALLGGGAVLVVSMLARSGDIYGKQGLMLLFGVSAPWLGNVLQISGLSPVPNLDPTPFCLLLTGLAMSLGISRFGLLDVVPVARSAVVEGMADGVIVLDAQDRVLDLNPAARPLVKLPASEAVGLPADKVLSSDELLRELGRDGAVAELRVGAWSVDGEGHRDYEVAVTPLQKAGRRRRVRLIVARDVTERAEKDLLFRLVVDNSSDIVSIYDRSGNFRYVSPSAERVLGYGPDEAIGLGNDPTIIHPEDRPWVLERRKEIWARPGVNGPMVFRVRHKDGSWRHVEGVFNNLLADPRVGAVVASWRDVTKRVEAEEEVWLLNAVLERRVVARTAELEGTLGELAASEKRYRAIFENAVEGIFQSTAEGRLVTANPAMARILGYASTEELVSSVADLGGQLYVRSERREEFAREMREKGAVSGFEVEVYRKDGATAWASASARALRDEGGRITGYEGSIEDITERVEARRTLEQRLAALTRMAASLTVDQPTADTLDSLAAGVVETTAALACSVYLIEPKGGVLGVNKLLFAGHHGLPEGYTDAVRASWRGGSPSAALSSFESRSPLLVRGGRRMLLDDPLYAPVHAYVRGASWDAIHITPLVAHGEALGTINAYYPPGEEPGEDEQTFLRAVADQAAVAVENSRLFAAARGAAVLQERQRLSRELHDSVSQALYGIALGSRTARTLLDRDPSRAVEPLEYVLSLAEAGLAEMRALIFELRPDALESEGLVAALQKQADALRARHGIPVRLELCEEVEASPEVREALYRIAQESMYNTVKHAGASNVDLTLERGPGSILLEVRDDGTGFDPSGSFPGHLGLRSMRERAVRLGGALEIESAPGSGTRVRARIPL